MSRLQFLATLISASVLIACTDDPAEPRYADMNDARIRIVAGDGQVAPVATSPARARDLSPGAYTFAALEDSYDLFPEVLEVVVTAGGASQDGLDGEPVPPGMHVRWIVRTEGCGAPLNQTENGYRRVRTHDQPLGSGHEGDIV